MTDKVKKALFVALGAAAVTKSQLESKVKVLVKGGRISVSQGKKVVDRLYREGLKQRKTIRAVIDRELDRVMPKAAPKKGKRR